MHGNRRAFLAMLAWSELGPYLAGSEDGYNVLVGGARFFSYADHPRKKVTLFRKQGDPIVSTAAGRYQILARYYDHYKTQLRLPDFSPASQDAIALQMIRERRALDDIDAGRFLAAIDKCKNIWASLPNAGYGQPEHDALDLLCIYLDAGGELSRLSVTNDL